MAITKDEKRQIIIENGASEKNTGSTETQIALLSARILYLTEHFKVNKKDTNSRRGMLKLIGQRRRLLKYLQGRDMNGYRALLEKLQIRK